MLKTFLKNLIYFIVDQSLTIYHIEKVRRITNRFGFKNVTLAYGHIEGNIEIGGFTYINKGYRIVSGIESKIVIGKYCSIGRNFMCASRTHSKVRPTADLQYKMHEIKQADIDIGSYVWIGDNVIVREGVKINDYAIIGANSVVTKDVDYFEIVGGVPARHISFNKEHYVYHEWIK